MVGNRGLCQLNRLAWSYLVLSMAAEHGWSDAEQGTVKASFAGGYLLLQVAGGVLGDHFGNKPFQVAALAACALAMGAAPLAADLGGPAGARGAAAVYFLLGLALGPQHPTSTAHQKKWCLPAETDEMSTI